MSFRSGALSAILLISSSWAVDPWPGETWAASTNLTFLDSAGWSDNLSGAYWNPVTRRLWVVNNAGNFSALKENGSGSFVVEKKFSPGGDLEGITQADPSTDRVYTAVERLNLIREYVASTGVLNRTWNLTSIAGGEVDSNDGLEGIAFVPNASLAASGFRDGSGNLYPQSVYGVNGLGGIMLVATQDQDRITAGYVYAVDLKNDGTWTAVGKYQTSREESCELTFDASINRLYILHSIKKNDNVNDNYLEVTDLTSGPGGLQRKFTTLREIQVPSNSNIEGFAVTPALKDGGTAGDGWAFFTDDDNANGALRWFKQVSNLAPVNVKSGPMPMSSFSSRWKLRGGEVTFRVEAPGLYRIRALDLRGRELLDQRRFLEAGEQVLFALGAATGVALEACADVGGDGKECATAKFFAPSR